MARAGMHPAAVGYLICLLLAIATVSGADTVIVVAETVAGTQSLGGDVDELGRIAKLERSRLEQQRAALGQVPQTLERIIRQDIGSGEAELERIAISRGETIVIARRRYLITPGRIEVRDGPRLVVVDIATRTAMVDSGSSASSWQIQPAPPVRPLSEAKAGDRVLGRDTISFDFEVDGRPYRALVDPGLANPYPLLRLAGAETEPLIDELARLPGFPLLVEQQDDRVVRRWIVQEIK
jgi:hypothetical protein